jgi:indolepyruvate ferredoxin oxidoreductase
VEADMTLDDLIAHRSAHLVRYQGRRLADRYESLVARARAAAAAAGQGDAVPRAVARTYARVLAYKDEYEVARLFTQSDYLDGVRGAFDGDVRVSFALAPPGLSGRAANGRPAKRRFGAWMLPVFRVLAKGKRLRGTVLDPFGHSADRRLERAMIGEYERLADRVLGRLHGGNAAAAAALLARHDGVRGYGPVKHEAYLRVTDAVERDLAAFEAPKGAEAVAAE